MKEKTMNLSNNLMFTDASNASNERNQNQSEYKNKNIFIALTIFFIILSSVLSSSLAVFAMQVILTGVTLPVILKKSYKFAKCYFIIFAVSLLYIFLVYYANSIYYGTPYYIGGSDDLRFEIWGYSVYNANTYAPQEVIKIIGNYGLYHNSPLYAVYISLLMRFSDIFGGYNTFLPRIINVYILIWVCFLFEFFLKEYAEFSEKKIRVSIMLFALTPNVQYINSHVFRDTLNLFQILLTVYLFDRLLIKTNVSKIFFNISGIILLLYITYYIRIESIVFASGLCFLVLLKKFKLKKNAVFYIFLISFIILITTGFLEVIRLNRFIEVYTKYLLDNIGDGLSSYIFAAPLFPAGFILRMLYAFITPFPNINIFNNSSKILFDIIILLINIGVIIQILLIPFIIKRIAKMDLLSLSFFVMFIPIIITTFTFRHILLYFPFMVALAADGYYTSKPNIRNLSMFFAAYTAMYLFMIYLLLK